MRDLSAVSYTISESPNSDGVYVAECNELPFCVAEGTTPQEAWENIKTEANRWLAILSRPVMIRGTQYPNAA